MFSSVWLCVCLRPSAAQEEITELFPQVSHPSFAFGKSTSKHFFLLPITTCVQRQFLQMQWFSILLLLLIFVLPSKSLKICLDFHTVFKRIFYFPSLSGFSLCLSHFISSSFASSLHFSPQNSVSFSQNNNNKLSDAARWPAHTPEGTESHSSPPTDNPLCKASLPLLEQCSHLHQSDPQIDAGKRLKRGSNGKKDIQTDCRKFSAENDLKRGSRRNGQ